jgi:hypothetical protein
VAVVAVVTTTEAQELRKAELAVRAAVAEEPTGTVAHKQRVNPALLIPAAVVVVLVA